jgi:cytidylate kinase
MAIITISRQVGSLGTEIAKMLKEELNFNYLDKESLEVELVNKYGIPEEKVERYDEKKPAFWDIFSSDKDRYLHFMKTAIYEFARQGNCIIIGRGGQILLKDVPGVLHVRVIAPTTLRMERIKTKYNYNDQLAEQIIRHSDHDRTGFHRFFFHINWEEPCLYDLMINTNSFTTEAAVRLIKDALDATGIMDKQPEKDSKLVDLCLSQEVITSIAYIERIPVQFLEVVAVSGIVTLRGSTITTEDISRCAAIARKVPGVKEVINEVYYIPNTYGMT